MRLRTVLLVLVLAGVALAWALDRPNDAAHVGASRVAAAPAGAGAAAGKPALQDTGRPTAVGTLPATPEIDILRPRNGSAGAGDLFAVQDWRVPPAKPLPAAAPVARRSAPPAPAPVPPPVAPPLPFTVLGKKFEDGRWEVFLAARERTYVVREKETIDRLYRVESIVPPNLVLTYLPLDERQVLAIGGALR
ncbi:MAG: hypothetical protein ACKVQQ_04830 [Burkholderiales bacterium]